MSKVRADSYTNRAGDGAPTFAYGSVVTGIQTATSFKGAGTELTGTANNLTVNAAQGLSGTPSISGNAVTASGNIGYSAKGSSSGLVNINGLPFTSGGSTHRCGGWANYSSFFSTETDNSTVQLYLGDSRTNMETLHDSQDNLNASDCNSAGQMNFTVLYQV